MRGAEQTWTGAISDSMCGASHAGMRTHGEKITDRECTVACLSYQTPDAPKYVFVSAREGLSDREPEVHAASGAGPANRSS